MIERHMVQLAPETPAMRCAVGSIYNIMLRDFPPKPLEKWTQKRVVDSVPVQKKRLVVNAFNKLNEFGWDRRFERIEAFIKHEKAAIDPLDPPEGKAPRLIQHRDPAYCYTYAQYVKPMEKALFGRKHINHGIPCSTKGMDAIKQADVIIAALRTGREIIVEVDSSRFDSRMRALFLATMHRHERQYFPGDSWLSYLQKVQLKNAGRTMNGTTYKVTGTVMSGDITTSYHDSKWNYCMLRWWAGDDAVIIVNGDDSLVFVDAQLLARLDMKWFDTIGFTVKTRVVYDIRESSYCQCSPIRTLGGWRMVRDPIRVMSRLPFTTRVGDGNYYSLLANSVAQCELSNNRGVPVLQALFARLLECNPHSSVKVLRQYMWDNQRVCKIDLRVMEVTPEARLDFWFAFGIDPAQQRSLEESFRKAPLFAF
jgi:hypothetical protein